MTALELHELSLIVPVKNESANIVSLVEEIASKVAIPHRVYIVYDSDDDNTLDQRDSQSP